jgi:DNA-binding CsgD family transcriptional regulator
MKYYLLLIALLSLTSLSSQNSDIDELQIQITNSLFKKPDSAKAYLSQLLNYSSQRHDTAVARTFSNLGITYNQLAVYDSATHYFKKGVGLVNEYPIVKAQILCNLAINYRTNADYSNSMKALQEALSIYKALDNLNGEGLVYGEMASNYNYMAQKEKAITYLKKAISIFRATNDSRLYILQQKLGNAYYNNGNYNFAVEIYEQVIPEFQKQKGAPYYLTLLAFGESLIEIGRKREGEERLIEAKIGLREVNNLEYMYLAQAKLAKLYSNTHRPGLAETAFKESYTYLRDHHSTRFLQVASDYLEFLNKQGALDKAVQVISETKTNTENFRFKMNAQDELKFLIAAGKTLREKKEYEASLQLFDRIDFLKDSIGNAEDRIKIAELEESYQNEIQGEKNKTLATTNALLQESSSKQRNITILSCILTIFIFVLSIAFYKSHRKKLRLQQESLSQLEKANSILKEKQELEKQLSAEKEKRLGDKERELVAISLEAADIQNQIREVLETKRDAPTSEICNTIENIIGQRNYWNHFKTKFVEVHPEFGYNLGQMFPELTDNDIAFCSLLKLQLTNKEIASLLGISHQSVISKKYRVKKKMQLHDNDESFDQLMREL